MHVLASWFVTGWSPLAAAAAKAALMYVAALVGLRLAHRRTLAQWTAIDFAAAVAVGAIVGRTAVAGEQSLATGVVALATILAVHGAGHAGSVPQLGLVADRPPGVPAPARRSSCAEGR